MSVGSTALLLVAGFGAGAFNAVAGGGSLLTFPALLAVGHSPLVANVTNTVGLLPGYLGGTLAYRRELAGQGHRVRDLGLTAALGAALGCLILLNTSAAAFTRVAPYLVLTALALLSVQPRLTRALRRYDQLRRDGSPRDRPIALHASVFAAGVYASYFGAAVGVVLLAVLGLFVTEGLQRLNALKGTLSLISSILGAVVFLAVAPVDLSDAGLLAVASLAGGRLGGGLARRLPPTLLRGTILVVGLAVALHLLV